MARRLASPRAQRRGAVFPFLLSLASATSGCGSPPRALPPQPGNVLTTLPDGSLGRIEVRHFERRPRITLVSRDGDPKPAIAVSVVVPDGPIASTGLAALLEARLASAGYHAPVRPDRGSLHVTWRAPSGGEPGRAFVEAVAASFRAPITPSEPALSAVMERLALLDHQRFSGAAEAELATCTGRLGLVPGVVVPDMGRAEGIAQLETWRTHALHTGSSAIAVVGPAEFCAAVGRAVEDEDEWPVGLLPPAAWPSEDRTGAYIAEPHPEGVLRLSVAVRTGSAPAAVAAAERLGRHESPLRSHLDAASPEWRMAEVVGVARPRGGCLAVTVERPQLDGGGSSTPAAAVTAVASTLRAALDRELTVPTPPSAASRLILDAADPTEAAMRAAWWSLSATTADAPRAVAALGVAPQATPSTSEPALEPWIAAVRAGLAAGAAAAAPAVDARIAVERGQGEMWVLVGSACGAADEGPHDAGLGALAAMAAVESVGPLEHVVLEPFVSTEGVGVFAHGSLVGNEGPDELARRLGEAAARAMGATEITDLHLSKARARALTRLESVIGRSGVAFDAFAEAAAPDHPTWLTPLSYQQTASAGLDAVRNRWRALRTGPIRVAVIANATQEQGQEAVRAVGRWQLPLPDRKCPELRRSPPRPGKYSAELPSHARRGQLMLGFAVGAGRENQVGARIAAMALDGPSGLLSRALSSHPGAKGNAFVAGNEALSALVLDVRVDTESLAAVDKTLRALIAELPNTALAKAQYDDAAEGVIEAFEARSAQPRHRAVALFNGRTLEVPQLPTLDGWKQWAREALKSERIIEVTSVPR